MVAQGGGGVDTSIDSPFSAWVSSAQAQVTFTDPSNDLTANYLLYSSQDPSCDIASYLLCTEGQQTPLDSFPASVTIRAWTLTTPAYYILENRDTDTLKTTNTNTIVPSQTFSARSNHQLVAFNDSIYLISGDAGLPNNDVWRSSNGTDWTLVEASADFSARSGHQVVVFKDSMYLIGGNSSDEDIFKNDIWRSSDGKDWTEITSDAGFPVRYGHQVVVFEGRMYVIGGVAISFETSLLYSTRDIWYSSNGKDWTEVTSDAGFLNRSNYQAVVFDGGIYVIGGNDLTNNTNTNDIWHSSNGTHWTEITSDAGLPARSDHQLVAFNDRMYFIGGATRDSTNFSFSFYNDVWSSSNGKDWTEDTEHAAFAARANHQVVVFKDSMYLIGGNGNLTSNYNDVWRSANGSDWMRGYSGRFIFE